jgi:hypothetical protein
MEEFTSSKKSEFVEEFNGFVQGSGFKKSVCPDGFRPLPPPPP